MHNKTKLVWVNPTQRTDGSAYDQQTEGAGYELSFNRQEAVVTLPFAYGTEFDMRDLEAYAELPSGEHIVGLRVVTREGAKSAYAEAPFRKTAAPRAPSHLAVD